MRLSTLPLGLGLLLGLLAGCGGSSDSNVPKPTPPTITAQPQNATVTQGQSASFTVAASGTAPLSYQWRKGGAAVTGGSGAALTLSSAQPGDAGTYDVVVSNGGGSATSSTATLTVNVPPAITVQPGNQTVLAPAAATFNVTATGTAPLSYQWKRNGVDLAGATSATYMTPVTSGADHGAIFSVLVSNVAGNLASANATLSVNVAAAISVQPQAQAVVAPAAASFSVTAVGTAPLAYQWKKNGIDIGGANAASYTTPATAFSDHGSQYSVVVSNVAGNATSSPATLTVNSAPVILVQPANQTVSAPAAATFSVSATGTAPLSYQWKKGGVDIGGATASSYTTPATVLGDSGSSYSVTVTNAFGSVSSGSATLTVNPPAALDLTVPTVYITQATQTQAFNVPLVKDRDGYLRAFVVASAANTASPSVRVRIYNAASALVQTYTITAPGGSVPLSVNESSLSNSWNVAIPSTYIQTGYKLLVDVDPTNAIAEGNEANNSWPVSGSPQTLDVRTLNPFRVTFWSVQTGDARVGNVSLGLAASFTSLLEKFWPTNNATDRLFGGTFTVTDILGASGTWSSVLGKLDAKRTADGVTNRYYYGVVNPNYSGGIAGMGYIGWPTAIGWDKSAGYSDSGLNSGVYAHEVGHNFGLNHAPCGGAGGPDPAYPYAGGVIGAWGTDVSGPTLKDPTVWKDIMGYCPSVWVSDYNYKKVLANREGGSVPIIVPEGPADPATARSLLLWGRLEDGVALLQPAFHMAVDALPPQPGDQLLEGFDARGQRLFAASFGLVEVGCLAQGSAHQFSFSIPLAPAEAARLAELRWTKAGEPMAQRTSASRPGPQAARAAWEPLTQVLFDGRTRLLWDASALPMVMVRDQSTGLVVGFGEGGDFRFSAEADQLDLHFSDGVRSHSMVVRRPRLGD